MKTSSFVSSWHRLSLSLLFFQLLSWTRALTPFWKCGYKCHPKSIDKRTRVVLFGVPRTVASSAVEDSAEELESIRSWKSTSAKAKEAEIVYRAPSFLDFKAYLEIKKRIHGWHTVRLVGGPTKSIYHGVFRKDETTGLVDPFALGPSEYIRIMASAALCLSVVSANETIPKDDCRDSTLRFLHMGYGSGSLMRLLRCAIPKSQHEAIDLDPTVVDAAAELGLLDPLYERLTVGDALEYSRETVVDDGQESSPRFHGICIDVFDGANLMPDGFYAVPFLESLRDNILETEGCSFVIHNFHVGTDRLEAQLKDAMASYQTVFGTSCCAEAEEDTESKCMHSLYRVDSLSTDSHGGNTILIAIKNTGNEFETRTSKANVLMELATLATEQWGFERFEIVSRIQTAHCF